VNTSKTLIRRLAKEHPHSAALLKAFVPLWEARNFLAENLPPPKTPAKPDALSFSQGKAWLDVKGGHAQAYLDEDFLKTAPAKLLAAAVKGFPDIKEALRALRDYLKKNKAEAATLTQLQLTGNARKLAGWSKKNGQNRHATMLAASHLALAAAQRLARAASSAVTLPPWRMKHCPICGSPPHASVLRGKEGKRFLQCSLCGHGWAFSRTSCPVCGQDSPQEMRLFFLEQNRRERAEACNICKRYLLGIDMREADDDIPLDLLLLCMMHLDMMMQEAGFVPATNEAPWPRKRGAGTAHSTAAG
jgi:FdhE protein